MKVYKYIKVTNCSFYIGNGNKKWKIRRNQNMDICVSELVYGWDDNSIKAWIDYYHPRITTSSESKIVKYDNQHPNHDKIQLIKKKRKKAKKLLKAQKKLLKTATEEVDIIQQRIEFFQKIIVERTKDIIELYKN